MSGPSLVTGSRPLTYREVLYELRRTRLLFEADRITLSEWCASVHRIMAAWRR